MLLWAAVMATCVTAFQNISAGKQQPPEHDVAAVATAASNSTKQMSFPLNESSKRADQVLPTNTPGKVAFAAETFAVASSTTSSSAIAQGAGPVENDGVGNSSKVTLLLHRNARTATPILADSPNVAIAAVPELSGIIGAESHVRRPESLQQQQQPLGSNQTQLIRPESAVLAAETVLKKTAAPPAPVVVAETLQQPPERGPGDVRPEDQKDTLVSGRTTTLSERELGMVAQEDSVHASWREPGMVTQEISAQGSQTDVGAATIPTVASSASLQPTAAFEEKPRIDLARSWGAAVPAEPEPVWEEVADASVQQVVDHITQEPGLGGSAGGHTTEVAAFGPPVLWVPVGLLAAWLLACGCCLTGFFASSTLWRRATCDAVRSYIEELPVSRTAEINRDLPLEGGYDCALSRPTSTQRLLRLEARVQRPQQQTLLTAPFTKRPCVIYSCSVSRLLHDSAHPVPSAFATDSIDFQVSLVDAPHIEVEVRGEDVCLFEMRGGGQYVERRGSERLHDAWSDFMMAHRTAPHPLGAGGLRQRPGGIPLEMRECALVVGATVTLVGELHRTGDGTLALRPLLTTGGSGSGNSTPRGLSPGSSPPELWRTSWEHGSEIDDELAAAAAASEAGGGGWEQRIDKVLVCDDLSLMDGFGRALLVAWSRTGSILLAALGEAWSGRLLRRTRRAD